MKINHIDLEGEVNARDLGGYIGAEGKTIAPRRLIRSGKLSDLTEKDMQRLREEYDLRVVVDFRTSNEKAESPDARIPGVTYVEIPIFDEGVKGITHEKKDSVVPDFKKGAPALEPAGMVGAYRRIAGEAYSRSQYRKFFDVLLNNKEGCVLWHCTMGKDRAGMGAVYTLAALGVDMETIMEDYLATNQFCVSKVDDVLNMIRSEGGVFDETVARRFFSADREYLGAALEIINAEGSLEDYLVKVIGLTHEDIAALRNMYLQ